MVAQKMQRIQGIFREVQDGFSETSSLTNLFIQLDEYETEFRSVAYESASMCIALSDLKEDSELKKWKVFLKESAGKHDTQIHIGLGWALAQQSLVPESVLPLLEPMMRYRVLDGYGYYDGFFRKRKSIIAQQKPDFDEAVASRAYDQGLGRSIWYLSQGELEAAQRILDGFPAERQTDLWRGFGIAVGYVGGLNESSLKEILSASGKFKPQLAAGVAMSILSRQVAGFLPQGIEPMCKAICRLDVNTVWKNNETIRSKMALSDNSAYEKCIQQLETLFGN